MHGGLLALPVRSQGDFGGGHRWSAEEWPFLCDEADALILRKQVMEERVHTAAMWAVVIEELNDRHIAGRVAEHHGARAACQILQRLFRPGRRGYGRSGVRRSRAAEEQGGGSAEDCGASWIYLPAVNVDGAGRGAATGAIQRIGEGRCGRPREWAMPSSATGPHAAPNGMPRGGRPRSCPDIHSPRWAVTWEWQPQVQYLLLVLTDVLSSSALFWRGGNGTARLEAHGRKAAHGRIINCRLFTPPIRPRTEHERVHAAGCRAAASS